MNRLKQLRTARRLSLRALAERTGIEFSSIAYYERGERNFSVKNQQILADFFGVSVDYLLGKSAEEMFSDFMDSLRWDFLTERRDGSGEVVQAISDSVSEPMRTKLEILFLLREINSAESLDVIRDLAKLRRANEDFSGED